MGLHSIDGSLKVYVGGLPADVTAADLEAHFKQLGEPTGAEVVRKGVGCIAYSTKEEAEIAISAFNASELKGSVIQTESWASKFAGGKGPKGGSKGAWDGGKGMGKWGFGGFGGKGYEKGGWSAEAFAYPGFGMKGGFGGPPPCKFFAQGTCRNGKQCNFSHDQGYGGGYGPGPYGLDPYTLMVLKGGWGKDSWGKDGFGKGKGKGDWGKGFEWDSRPRNTPITTWFVNVPAKCALIKQGFPAEAPAVLYDKEGYVFSNASCILSDIVGDEEVVFEDDADWKLYPEVGDAVKEAAGEESCLGIYKCPSKGKYGVGVANGWKGRQTAGKLALAVAIVREDKELIHKIAKNYREFGRLCQDLGFIEGTQYGRNRPPADKTEVAAASPTASTPPVYTITLPKTSKLVSAGGPTEGPAIYHSKEQSGGFFRAAHHILGELLGEKASELKFVDDPDWEVMPEVGAALKTAGGEEICYTVVTGPTSNIWGVGCATGWKGREPAAKLALALALVQAAGKVEEFAQKPEYYHFGLLCASLGLTQAPPKKQKVEKAAPAAAS